MDLSHTLSSLDLLNKRNPSTLSGKDSTQCRWPSGLAGEIFRLAQ
jgi:hypothetical protein